MRTQNIAYLFLQLLRTMLNRRTRMHPRPDHTLPPCREMTIDPHKRVNATTPNTEIEDIHESMVKNDGWPHVHEFNTRF